MNTSSNPILICAGGTGGHVVPARALADELLARGQSVVVATDTRGEKYFKGLDVPLYIIDSSAYQPGLVGKGKSIVKLLKGYAQAHRLISRYNPCVAVGFGGYPSAPPMFAAQHRGIPTVLQEQNAVLGLANILLAPWATLIALAFPATGKIKPAWQKKCVMVGNPIRHEIAELAKLPYPDFHEFHILVTGGSQGAKVFGTLFPEVFVALSSDIKSKLKLSHQVRTEDEEGARKIYEGSGVNVEIKPFFDDMPERLKTAHLVIGRSGASTVTELTACGRPAIYIPFPRHTDNQQVVNAKFAVDVGGGWMILEKDLTKEGLLAQLTDLLSHPEKLAFAAQQAKSIGKPDAVQDLADKIQGLF